MRRSALLLVALFVLLLGLSFGLWWWQQENNFSSEERTETLRVQPQAVELTAKPDDFVTLVFVVRNESAGDLSLQAAAPPGWSLLEIPTEIRLDAGQAQEIFVTAQIPPGTPPGDFIVSLTAQDAAERAIGRTRIKVAHLERIKIALPQEQPMLHPGAERAIPVTVTNRGNVRLSAKLRVTGAPPGWRFSLSVASFALDPGSTQSVELRIRAPEQAISAPAIFTIEAVGGRAVDKATLTVVLSAP